MDSSNVYRVLKFNYTSGSSFTGDFALDNVDVTVTGGKPYPPHPFDFVHVLLCTRPLYALLEYPIH